MRDELKRLQAKNFFKQWAPSDFNIGNSFTQEEYFTAVPSGTRCVLESFSSNAVYSGSAIGNSSGINNERDSSISFRTGSSTGPLIFEVKPQFSSYGVILFGKNFQSSLFDIPCSGVLFDDGLFVGLTARTATSSGSSDPDEDYGFNVNIFYSGGS